MGFNKIIQLHLIGKAHFHFSRMYININLLRMYDKMKHGKRKFMLH